MAVQPAQLDPLPIPQLTGENSPPAPPQPQQAQPLPQQAGFVGKSGAAAYVASNIITGWMAGRQYKQQRELYNARQDIVGAKTAYDVTAQNYQNLIDQGLDPNKPEDAQKLNAAKTAAGAAWNNYLDRAQKYSTPDDGGKPKKKSVKDKAHDAFMGHDPQLFVDSSLKLLRQTGPPVLSYGTSQEEKQNQQIRQQTIQQNENTLTQQKHEAAQQADVDELRKQYKDAVAKGDEAGARKAREGLAGYGVNVQRVESEAEAQAADEVAKAKLEGIKTLNTPGKTSSDLTVAQRGALGIQLGEWDAYANEVGPGKKFKSAIDARRAYLRDAATAQAIAGNSATDRQWRQIKSSESVVLQHDLQDPATAKRYGLPGPLKPGQPVPDWLVEKAALGRLKPSAEDRANAKLQVGNSISKGIGNIVADMPAADAEFAKQALVDYDPDTKTWNLRTTPPPPETKHHIFGQPTETIGGVSQDEYKRKRDAFYGRLRNYLVKTNPGAASDRIDQALQSGDPAGFLVDNQPEESPTPGENRQMTPPPAAPNDSGSLEPVKGKYQVEADGQVKELELTSQEADYIQQQHPDIKVRKVDPNLMPHGR